MNENNIMIISTSKIIFLKFIIRFLQFYENNIFQITTTNYKIGIAQLLTD